MKKPYSNYAITLAVLFAVSLSSVGTASAELVSEEVQESAIQPEEGADASSDDLIIVNQKPAAQPVARRASTRRMVRREIQQPAPQTVAMEEPAMEVETVSRAQVAMPVAAAPARKSVGSAVDQTIQNKMDGVREQFEQALVRQLDKIKITVDDSSPSVPAANAPMQTTIVADNVVTQNGAPEKANYMSIDSAPAVADEEAVAGASEAKTEEKSSTGSVRFSPVAGMTSINSDRYDVSSRYTAGFNIEFEMDSNLALYVGYSYSQYDIGLANSNPFYNAVPMQPTLTNNSNLSTLLYNQNVFEGGLRLFLMPMESRFRAHVGAGLGYNKGYLNYKSVGYYNTYQYNPFQNQQDYEVTSFLGILETGAEFKVSKNVAIGALFKYDTVLSSRENQPLNNYGFINNGFNTQPLTDKQIVGGSIAKDSFYSILGTVKVSF